MKTKKKESKKSQTAFRLSNRLLEALKIKAKQENRSLNNYVEVLLSEAMYKTPNVETLEAIAKARNNEILEKIDNIDDFLDNNQ